MYVCIYIYTCMGDACAVHEMLWKVSSQKKPCFSAWWAKQKVPYYSMHFFLPGVFKLEWVNKININLLSWTAGFCKKLPTFFVPCKKCYSSRS